MAVQIRYKPTDLTDEGVVETIAEVVAVAMDRERKITFYNAKDEEVGFVNPDRWDRVLLIEETP